MLGYRSWSVIMISSICNASPWLLCCSWREIDSQWHLQWMAHCVALKYNWMTKRVHYLILFWTCFQVPSTLPCTWWLSKSKLDRTPVGHFMPSTFTLNVMIILFVKLFNMHTRRGIFSGSQYLNLEIYQLNLTYFLSEIMSYLFTWTPTVWYFIGFYLISWSGKGGRSQTIFERE